MKKSKALLVFTLCGFLGVVTILQGESLSVSFQRNVYSKGRVHSYFLFSGDISYDTVDAVRNGITARLVLIFQLVESGGVFGSVKDVLRERVESFNLTYDVWENSFRIVDRNRDAEYMAASASEVLFRINEAINPVKLSASSVRDDEKLIVRAKIRIQTIKLYPPFGIFLFFFDPWNYETSWIYSDVFTVKTLRGSL
ncbi:MAG: hypothetical protein AMS17_10630 [Spirochaetes bacterium DG_61]|jgi:hypothetical protein|nr:MAG: hypothetical protein AMS17_10630 [Spirochaetes bacterium DG_61]